MNAYLAFSKTNSFPSFFVDSVVFQIEEDSEHYKHYFEGLPDIFEIREAHLKVVDLLLQFTFKSKDLSLEQLKLYSNNDVSEQVLTVVYPYYLANLDKFVLLKSKIKQDLRPNEIHDYKINIQTVLTHQNINKLDRPSAVLEINSGNGSSIFEFNEDELQRFTEDLKLVYAKLN